MNIVRLCVGKCSGGNNVWLFHISVCVKIGWWLCCCVFVCTRIIRLSVCSSKYNRLGRDATKMGKNRGSGGNNRCMTRGRLQSDSYT